MLKVLFVGFVLVLLGSAAQASCRSCVSSLATDIKFFGSAYFEKSCTAHTNFLSPLVSDLGRASSSRWAR
jgi:hypothetical protein